MGAIWMTRGGLVNQLKEALGYKSGLALSNQYILEITPENLRYLIHGSQNEVLRARADDLEDLCAHTLFVVGASKLNKISNAFIRLCTKYGELGEFSALKENLASFASYLELLLSNKLNQPFSDPGPSIRAASNTKLGMVEVTMILDPYHIALPRYFNCAAIDWKPFLDARLADSENAAKMASEIIEELLADYQQNIFVTARRCEFSNLRELQELFGSRNLGAHSGEFFDQRFVDYLERNFESIDQIHWRQFEGLVCEYFKRIGFTVEIGPGSNDDGVDARIWSGDPASGPPQILVQCKRQKELVDKVTVKALYADVVHEGAQTGLIVTSHELAPGTEAMRIARGYPIFKAERETLRSWLKAMRTPGTGL